MIVLVQPWAAVLLVPAALAWWWLARTGNGRWWRAALLLLLVLAATQPQLLRQNGGSDVILVLDRSASMGEAVRHQDEVMRLAGEHRKRGDRLGVIAFGAAPAVAQGPANSGLPHLSDLSIDVQGSDIDAALEQATGLLTTGRTARMILISDGETTGPNPQRSAARLALQGTVLDVLPERRGSGVDAAIADLELPGALRQGESFLGAVVFVSDRPEQRAWKIHRGQHLVASGVVALTPGRETAVSFTDRPPIPGLIDYRVELDDRDDRQPANNRACGWVRIEPGERVLVVGGDGSPSNISRAIAAAGIQVTTRAAGPLRLADLLGCQALVLAEVPAGKVGHAGMTAIARWVQHFGGGLVMTGGKNSFGCGGWYASPVEPILPVSLEVRDEHRVLSVAMAIAIDRSGSMSVQCADGRQKIELAGEGAAAAIELLGPRDQIAVLAVDTEPHEILPMTKLTDPKAMVRDVLGIRSAGGGIFIYAALAGAGLELLKTTAGTRHLLLFADAADSEEPGDYIKLLADYRKQGITVSVVGMGSEKDSDAALLIDVAKRGGGRIAFAEDPADIPRLFAQETVLVARNPWIDHPLAPQPQTGAIATLLGATGGPLASPWPTVSGYNLTYPRPRSEVLAWCQGDPKAPAGALWHIGAGRSVALPIPCDAPGMATWPGYAPLLASAARWAAGGGGSAPGALLTQRRGGMATIRLELDPEREKEWPSSPPELHLVSDDPSQPTRPITLQREDRGTWSAEIRLSSDRPLIPAVRLGTTVVLGPALALPMPAEVAPRRDLASGSAILAELARNTGGRVRGDLLGLYDNPPSPGSATELSMWLVIAALVILLAEIAIRRLRLNLPRVRLPTWRPRWVFRKRTAPLQPNNVTQPTIVASTPSVSAAPPVTSATPSSPTPPAPPPEPGGVQRAMEELRKRR